MMTSVISIVCFRISSDGIIKVADFGLSEDIYESEYFKQPKESKEKVKLPLKWMALESIHYRTFNERTDVVSHHIEELIMLIIIIANSFFKVVLWCSVLGGVHLRNVSIFQYESKKGVGHSECWSEVG